MSDREQIRRDAEKRFPRRDAERYAQRFHEAYERLAPAFAYETRSESAVPWNEVPEQNKALMVAVVNEVLGALLDELEQADTKIVLLHHRLSRVPALVEALNELAWRGEPVGDKATCAVCLGFWPKHYPGCYAGDALAAFEGEQ